MTPALTEDVLIRVDGKVGRLSLNRPSALHALTLEMTQAMLDALLAWRDDDAVEAVLIDHATGRGFCAGGDIRRLAETGSSFGRIFFTTEYRLNHLLFHFPKPVIAVLDGVTMGGGAGIGLPAALRIGTEHTLFAMPETGIGLIPDVGGGWYLPRLPGAAGAWLALTGARLRTADCLALGLVNHVVDSGRLDEIKAVLTERPEAAARVLATEAVDPGPSTLDRARIDALFGLPSVEAIMAALEADGSDWALAQLAVMRSRSPTSMKATLRQLRQGAAAADFATVLATEYRLATRLIDAHDFKEGVRAVVVEKDNAPVWAPATLAAVTDQALDALFAPYPPGEDWTPL